MVYLKDSLIVSSFLFLFIYNMVQLQRLVATTTDIRVEKPKKLKNICCPRSQKLWVLISSLASFELFNVLPCSSSPDYGISLDSILVQLHTSDIIFAVRRRKSLCRIYIKQPFLQLILCWISNLLSQGQDVGRLLISQSYRSLTESQNCCLDNSNPNSVSRPQTPVRVDISTRRFSLSFISVADLSITSL